MRHDAASNLGGGDLDRYKAMVVTINAQPAGDSLTVSPYKAGITNRGIDSYRVVARGEAIDLEIALVIDGENIGVGGCLHVSGDDHHGGDHFTGIG